MPPAPLSVFVLYKTAYNSHFRPFRWCNIWHCRILNNPSIQKFHNVEGRANNSIVFTETIGLWNGYVGFFEGMYYAVFPFDLMGGLGDKLSRWLLPHHIFIAIACGELVRGIGLSKTKLMIRLIYWLRVRVEDELGYLCTCFTSTGTLISGTFWEMYRSSD